MIFCSVLQHIDYTVSNNNISKLHNCSTMHAFVALCIQIVPEQLLQMHCTVVKTPEMEKGNIQHWIMYFLNDNFPCGQGVPWHHFWEIHYQNKSKFSKISHLKHVQWNQCFSLCTQTLLGKLQSVSLEQQNSSVIAIVSFQTHHWSMLT